MSSMNKKLKYGKKDLLPHEPFDPKKAKIRISILIDGDVLEAYKATATRSGAKYQTLMNQKLREAIEKQGLAPELAQEIRSLIRQELKKVS